MGESAFVNQTSSGPARAARQTRPARLGLDFPLISVVAALILFGLLMVYSSSPLAAARLDQKADYFLRRQIIWVILGTATTAFLYFVNYRWLKRLSVLLIVGTFGLLVLVPIIGESSLGAVRSILGPSVRPSELAKLVLLIYVAVWLDAKKDVLNDISVGLIPLIVILGFTAFLIFIQPDLSAALTVVVIGLIMFFLAGAEWRQIALILAGTVLVGWVLVSVVPIGQARMAQFIAGIKDPTNASDHLIFSFQAIISGGLFGTGIGMSSLKFIGLPVAHTDSIFAVIAEETGLVGMFLLLAAYLVILWRGLSIARRAPDKLGRMLAAGVTIWIILEAFINISVMVNLFPNAGNALPFISYGGSSLVTTMAGIGILLNIGRMAEQNDAEGEKTFGSVVDLRWRNGRRRVSRTVRSASSR